jgi:hypothetical protein
MDQQRIVNPAKGLLDDVYNDNAQEVWDNGGFKANLPELTAEEFKTSCAGAKRDPGQTFRPCFIWCQHNHESCLIELCQVR